MVSKYATIIAALIIIASTFLQAQTGMSQLPTEQSLPDSIKTKVDKIFSRWDSAAAPGCVVGIVRNDSLIYARGYGLANVEDNVANTPPERILYLLLS